MLLNFWVRFQKEPFFLFSSDGKHSRIDFLLGNLYKMVGISGETQHFHFPRWWSSLFWGHSLESTGVSQINLFFNSLPTQLFVFINFSSCFIFKLRTNMSLCHKRNWTCSRGRQEVVDGIPRDASDSSSSSLSRPSLARFKGCSRP